MSIPEALVRVSSQIYDTYCRGGAGGIAFFRRFETQLRAHPDSEVVAQQVRSYDLHYVMDFLLSMPGPLARMSTSDWARVFTFSGPRPRPSPSEIQMEKMGDIFFVGKYLRLNAVEFILRQKDVRYGDKEAILHKSRLCAPLFELAPHEEEDLDGQHFVPRPFLQEVANRLLAERKWSPLPNQPEEILRQFSSLRVPD